MPKTVLVTGATGFIAKHIVAGLLNRGHSVVGSARSLDRDAEIRAAVGSELTDPAALDRYRTVALDLSSDDGWAEAMEGVEAVLHTASPFPLAQPKDPQDVIKPAVDGALRAISAARAAGVRRVILTSSSGAITVKNGPTNGSAFTEEDWTDVGHPAATPYFQSKTFAEQAAWDDAKANGDIDLTVINPSFVVGPPLDANFGTSIRVVERLLIGKDPMLPRFGFPAVDVRDVAEGHIRALERDETIGERIMLADRFLWFSDMAEAVDEALPNRKIVKRIAPDFVIRFLALFDKEIRVVVPILGRREDVDASKAKQILDMTFRDAAIGAADAARWLDSKGVA